MNVNAMRYGIIGLGHAILDRIAHVDDMHIVRTGLRKGGMEMVSADRARNLTYGDLTSPSFVATPGGSVANSLAVAAALGSKAAFIGRVADDAEGKLFRDGMAASGVDFFCRPAPAAKGTGLCAILVTPDGERTMATSLGASQQIEKDDIRQIAGKSGIFVFDGYLNDSDSGRLRIVDALGHLDPRTTVATSLGDSKCVARNRGAFDWLIGQGLVDVVFANEKEATALTGASHMDGVAEELSKHAGLTAFVTLGPDGCMIVSGGSVERVPAAPIEKLVDTTGAGDAFAGGVLHGLQLGLAPALAAGIGARAAAEIIQQVGARPVRSLAHLGLETAA